MCYRVPEIKIEKSKGLSKPQIEELEEEVRAVASNTIGEVSAMFSSVYEQILYQSSF